MFWKKKNSDEVINHPETFVDVFYSEKNNVTEVEKPLLNNDVVNKNVLFPGQELLTFESKNNYVKILQENLIKRGYSIPGGADGTYGIATVKAVQKFYDDNSLGINSGKHIGPKAWNKILGN